MGLTTRTKGAVAAGALLAAGVGGGAAVLLGSSASAEGGSATPGYGSGLPGGDGQRGPEGGDGRDGEEALTGDALEAVTAAVLAEYPDAEIVRAETDADGAAYEAHIVTAEGERLTVLLDESFAITGTETGPAGTRGGGPGGPGGDCGDGAPPTGEAPSDDRTPPGAEATPSSAT